nr:PREDICTED: E3 ubiquitin-protein ligase rififylin isoform X2 [Latimeria chalumnae]|eukprot:XP_014353189.1 PREDICTED: E3 ubiquitin-protein ligase rififylin isoform X2 [Latimeria chalumnae]
MWAACCNWFCLDSRTEEQEENQPTQVYTNTGYNSYPSPPEPEHVCKACRERFENAARKHVCVDCKKNFCTSCSIQPENSPRMCRTCQRFRATAFQREELMKLKVKDLRDYLGLHEISIELCREKEELVELVLGQQPQAAPDTQTHIPAFTRQISEQQAFLSNSQEDSAASPSPEVPLSYGEAVWNQETQPQENHQVIDASTSDGEEPADVQPESETQIEEETQSIDSEDILVTGRRASLSDLSCVQDIDGLTVRQLKEILARNFVDYKGCCEKWELMERVTRLYNEQKDLQNLGEGRTRGVDENLCKICMDLPIDCVLLECGHMVTCTKCGKRMSECPICRQYVIRAVHVFRS